MLCMVEISGEEIGDPQAKFGMNPCGCERNWKLILQRYAKRYFLFGFHAGFIWFPSILTDWTGGPQTKGGLSTYFCPFNGCALQFLPPGPLHQQDVPPGGFGDSGAAQPQVSSARILISKGPSVPRWARATRAMKIWHQTTGKEALAQPWYKHTHADSKPQS